MAHPIDTEMRECIERCESCAAICLETFNHCLELGGRHAAVEHIRLLMTCAEICGTSARLMLLGSSFHARTCEVCAEVCVACAKECERIDGENDLIRRCGGQCRRCAEACRHMVGVRA